jgi:hypothetical protein
MPLLIGAAVVVVVVLVLVFQSGGSGKANAGESQQSNSAAPVASPAVPKAEPVQLGSAKAGKVPTTPAPPLTQQTLQELSDLLQQVKTLRNEAVTARTGSSDTQLARAKMGAAKTLLDQWKQKVEAPLLWQESAQMEDWAQPAEYTALERLYATFQRYDNEVRKGGG